MQYLAHSIRIQVCSNSYVFGKDSRVFKTLGKDFLSAKIINEYIILPRIQSWIRQHWNSNIQAIFHRWIFYQAARGNALGTNHASFGQAHLLLGLS